MTNLWKRIAMLNFQIPISKWKLFYVTYNDNLLAINNVK